MSEIIITVIVCFSIGFIFGTAVESRFGQARREQKRLNKIVLRMIPKLKPYYTDEYIWFDLIRGNHTNE